MYLYSVLRAGGNAEIRYSHLRLWISYLLKLNKYLVFLKQPHEVKCTTFTWLISSAFVVCYTLISSLGITPQIKVISENKNTIFQIVIHTQSICYHQHYNNNVMTRGTLGFLDIVYRLVFRTTSIISEARLFPSSDENLGSFLAS
jgi:hypothetical protein